MEKKTMLSPKIGEIFNQFFYGLSESDFFQKYGILDMFFNFQIDENTKEIQANNLLRFAGYPKNFKIDNLDDIIGANLWAFQFLHIYFIYKDGKISLIFVFDLNEKNKVPLEKVGNVYVLEADNLIPIQESDLDGYKKYILDYYIYFNQNFPKHQITTYITYSLERIQKNFSHLKGGMLIIGGYSEDEEFYRPNIILEIDKKCCKSTLYYNPSEQDKVYFDIGNMQP